MASGLPERIYRAQCIGNVEPVEHMVPYPNLRALVEGQTIKHGQQLVYPDQGLSNRVVHQKVQQTAHWLASSGLQPKARLLLGGLPFPDAEVLAFGVWTLGASLVLVNEEEMEAAREATRPQMVVTPEGPFPHCTATFPTAFEPRFKALLNHEALVLWQGGQGIRLSHYNLLVNTNGVSKALGLNANQSFQVQLEPHSSAWAVFQVLLPFYSGAALTASEPTLTLGLPGQFPQADYILDFDWKKIQTTRPPSIYILPENSAVLAVNQNPIHLTAIQPEPGRLKIQGHSVMMGYLDEAANEATYREGWMVVKNHSRAQGEDG